MKIDTRKSEIAVSEVDADKVKWMSRRSYLTVLAGFGAGIAGWKWLKSTDEVDNAPWPLRKGFEFNEKISRALYDPSHLSPTFPVSAIDPPRRNGVIGLRTDVDPDTWRLNVSGLASGKELSLKLDDIKSLPRQEIVTELRCIEGWSLVVKWAGVAFRDFSKVFSPGKSARYVGLATPDGLYYVGMDLASAMHPQTLLCYEMNGAPLEIGHGAPLRLAIPSAYGIKHLKCIGSLVYSRERPADYWAERGYDYYSEH